MQRQLHVKELIISRPCRRVAQSCKSLGFVFNLYTHKLRSEAIANCIKNNNTMYVCLASSSNLYDLKLSKG